MISPKSGKNLSARHVYCLFTLDNIEDKTIEVAKKLFLEIFTKLTN